MQTIVELPSEFKSVQLQDFWKSIDMQEIVRDADKELPGVIDRINGGKLAFYFQPLTFKSFIGKPEHIVLRIDVFASPSWEKESEFKAFLAKSLLKRVAGAKVTSAILVPN
jgi:hypothetical protein